MQRLPLFHYIRAVGVVTSFVMAGSVASLGFPRRAVASEEAPSVVESDPPPPLDSIDSVEGSDASPAPAVDYVPIESLDMNDLLSVLVNVGATSSQSVMDNPATVEVLTAEQIERLGLRTLREVFLTLTGTYETSENLSPALDSGIRIRGGTVSSRILVLIEDHAELEPINDLPNLYQAPIGAIDRVEFLRGPAAILYGSSAMAGTLRVVLKKGERLGFGVNVMGDPVGRGAGIDVHASHLMTVGSRDLKLRIDTQAERGPNYKLFINGDVDGKKGYQRYGNSGVSTLATARYGGAYLRLQQNSARSRVLGLQSRLAFDPGPSSLGYYGGQLGYKHDVNELELQASLALDYFDNTIDMGKFPPGLEAILFHGTAEESRTNLETKVYVTEAKASAAYNSDIWNAQLGVQARFVRTARVAFVYQDDGTGNMLTFPPTLQADVNDLNLYFQGTAKVKDALTFLLGGRLNYYDRSIRNNPDLTGDDAHPKYIISPMGQAAVVWRIIPELTAKVMYGRSFRLPSLQETFTQIETVIRPNTLIDPEIMDTYELAFDAKILDNLTVRVDGFVNEISQIIRFQTPADDEPHFDNSPGSLRTYGGDLTVHFSPVDHFSADSGFTIQGGRDSNGKSEASMPATIAFLRVPVELLRDHSLVITPSVRYRGPLHDSESDVWVSLAADWHASSWLRVSLAAINIFNRQGYVPLGGNPGFDTYQRGARWIRFGVEANY